MQGKLVEFIPGREGLTKKEVRNAELLIWISSTWFISVYLKVRFEKSPQINTEYKKNCMRKQKSLHIFLLKLNLNLHSHTCDFSYYR